MPAVEDKPDALCGDGRGGVACRARDHAANGVKYWVQAACRTGATPTDPRVVPTACDHAQPGCRTTRRTAGCIVDPQRLAVRQCDCHLTAHTAVARRCFARRLLRQTVLLHAFACSIITQCGTRSAMLDARARRQSTPGFPLGDYRSQDQRLCARLRLHAPHHAQPRPAMVAADRK